MPYDLTQRINRYLTTFYRNMGWRLLPFNGRLTANKIETMHPGVAELKKSFKVERHLIRRKRLMLMIAGVVYVKMGPIFQNKWMIYSWFKLIFIVIGKWWLEWVVDLPR